MTGLLADEYLPAQSLVFGTVAIVHDPEIDKRTQKRPEVPIIEGHTKGVAIRPAIDVRSRWRVDFLLQADSGRDALEHAEKGFVAFLLAAFSAATGGKVCNRSVAGY
ncbi:MAG TPA: hypothetical protein VKB53_06500 [Gammaproteobacteria bacterium]|nr:hypothetical protein [Gammaproteobacteria bacterium]HKH20521.1 hypothetical protein [Gammaproteobacteria bacterium]